jgi:hypothetical protein
VIPKLGEAVQGYAVGDRVRDVFLLPVPQRGAVLRV